MKLAELRHRETYVFFNVTYITENDKLFHYNTKGKQDRSSLLSRLQKLCQ